MEFSAETKLAIQLMKLSHSPEWVEIQSRVKGIAMIPGHQIREEKESMDIIWKELISMRKIAMRA